MKTTKRFIMMLLTVIMLFSVVAICAQAASLDYTNANYGYMVPTDAKFTKSISTVKLYGDYDYINFLIESKSNDVYFFYEIYSDKDMTDLVGGGSTYCADSGSYVFSPAIKLKGNFKSDKTYYCVSYAATIDDAENVKVSEKSVKTFKLKVTLKPKFKQKVVILKSVKNTVDGPTISWKKLSSGTKKYVVYRKGITDAKWKKIATVKGDTYSYTDKSIKDKNVTYMYTVKGCDKNGTKTRCQYNGLLALYAKAPKVTAVNVTTDNKIEIKWKSSSPTATYRIYRSENNGKYKLVAKNITGTTYYDDTAKNSGSRYKYAVKAAIPTEYGTAVSSYKATKNRTFLAAPELNPVAVTDNGLSISWSSVNGATGYTVYRKTLDEKAEFSELAKVDANTLAFTDTTANAESAFSYTVRATTEKVNGSYNSKGAEYFIFSEPDVKIEIEEKDIVLTWEPVNGATSYNILEKLGDGSWEVVDTLSGAKNTKYLYSVSSYAEKELSVQAVRGNVTTTYNTNLGVIVFYPKLNVAFAPFSDHTVISWETTYAEKYNIYKKAAGDTDSEFKLIYSGKETSFTDKDVEYDTAYSYQIKGVYKGVEQTHNVFAKTFTTYNPEAYIRNAYACKRNIREIGYCYAYTPQVNAQPYSEYIFYMEYENEKAAKMKHSAFYLDDGSWKKIDKLGYYAEGVSIITDYDNYYISENNTKVASVLMDSSGSTPIDAFISTINTEEFALSPELKFTPVESGLKVSWKSVENARGYHINLTQVREDGYKYHKEKVSVDGSAEYSVVLPITADSKVYWNNISITTVNNNNNETEVEYVGYKLFKEPAIEKTITYNSKAVLLIKNTQDILSDLPLKFVVFRKAENEDKWTKIGSTKDIVGVNGVINAVEFEGLTVFEDADVQKGKKYKYTVKLYNTDTKEYVSYYDKNGTTVTVK